MSKNCRRNQNPSEPTQNRRFTRRFFLLQSILIENTINSHSFALGQRTKWSAQIKESPIWGIRVEPPGRVPRKQTLAGIFL
ncbi:MAG TPA: hypothetical protein DIV47_01460 [Candidatus Pacebacteria bacterium]|nr:hypothetical protein [Candidatus Paceibacterota bacterium]